MSFIITLVSLLFLIFFAKKFDFGHDNHIGEQKFHLQPTPRTGGLALVLGTIIPLFFDNHEHILYIIVPIIFLFNLWSSEFFDLDLTTEYTLKAAQINKAMTSILVIPIFFYK